MVNYIPLVDICDDLKGGLGAILVDLAGLDSLDVGLAGEAEDVKGIVASESNQFAAVRPVHLPWVSN